MAVVLAVPLTLVLRTFAFITTVFAIALAARSHFIYCLLEVGFEAFVGLWRRNKYFFLLLGLVVLLINVLNRHFFLYITVLSRGILRLPIVQYELIVLVRPLRLTLETSIVHELIHNRQVILLTLLV